MTLDKRIMRSRKWMLETLLLLLEVKDYKDITIKELTEKADIARQTFYRNYKSIDEILIGRMDEIWNEYMGTAKQFLNVETGDVKPMVRRVFTIWKENEKIFRAIQKAGLTHLAIHRYHDYVVDMQEEIIGSTEITTDKQRYLARFFAGGSFALQSFWFEENMKLSVEEITEIYDIQMQFLLKTTKEYASS